MTTVRIAHAEPRPGRLANGGFVTHGHLVVLADDAGHRAVPIWMRGEPGESDLSKLLEIAARPPAEIAMADAPEELTVRLLRAAGASVTGVDIDVTEADIDELTPQVAVARIGLAGPAGTREVTAGLRPGPGHGGRRRRSGPDGRRALLDRVATAGSGRRPARPVPRPGAARRPGASAAMPAARLAAWPVPARPPRPSRYRACAHLRSFADGCDLRSAASDARFRAADGSGWRYRYPEMTGRYRSPTPRRPSPPWALTTGPVMSRATWPSPTAWTDGCSTAASPTRQPLALAGLRLRRRRWNRGAVGGPDRAAPRGTDPRRLIAARRRLLVRR